MKQELFAILKNEKQFNIIAVSKTQRELRIKTEKLFNTAKSLKAKGCNFTFQDFMQDKKICKLTIEEIKEDI